jgi:hypothetical protein
VTARTHPARRCSWRDCPLPAAATVVFELPNLLAGSRRDYCAAHTTQVCMARGMVPVARFGPPPADPARPARRRIRAPR